MNTKFFAILGMIAVVGVAQAQIFVEWNFNSLVGDATTGTGSTVANIGSGTIANIGGTTNTFAAGGTGTTAPGNSSDPNNTDDSGYNTTGYPTQGNNSGTAGVAFGTSTAQGGGYQDILVEFDLRTSNTASKWFRFEYTLDGTAFTSAGLTSAVFSSVGGDSWNQNITFDLTSITAANNNANFGFRVVSIFAPLGGTYSAANATSTYATTGTVRFDMVQVSGQPVPEPTTIGALGLGLVAVARRIRRSK